MAVFTPEKRIQLETLRQAGIRAAAELSRLLGCCSRTVERELDRCAGRRYNAYRAGLDRQSSAARSAANVVVEGSRGVVDAALRLV